MGREEDQKTRLVQSIINYVRENHKHAIDKAYEYFWDQNSPYEFLRGTALSLGFINFEDWLIYDYKANEYKDTFIDIFINFNQELKSDDLILLNKIKASLLSLYEVSSVFKDKRVILKDMLIDGKFELRDKTLTKGLKKADIFATRLLFLDGKYVMSGCVYPYIAKEKKKILGYIDKQFKRYKKNANPDGTISNYLKDYGDIFNIIWMKFILGHSGKKDKLD